MNERIITSKSDLKEVVVEAINEHITKESDSDPILNNKEVMDYLSVSRSTLQRWRNEGILPYRKMQGMIFYKMSDIEEMLEDSKG